MNVSISHCKESFRAFADEACATTNYFRTVKTENPITYINGDATAPVAIGNKLIIHCCNNIGGWGSGFVLALSKRWKAPEAEYRTWSKNKKTFKLGNVQIVPVAEGLAVANMIGQFGCGAFSGRPPIRYRAIKKCLKKVRKYCKTNNVSVHAPRFGSALAGGKWEIIEALIIKELTSKGIPVTIYDFE